MTTGDRHWEHDDEPDYVKVAPYETIISDIKGPIEIELTDGEIVDAHVHYHYTEEVPGTYEDPPEPAEVDILRVKVVDTGRVLYSCREEEWLASSLSGHLISDKAFEDLRLHLLENWGY